jgi:hypothetical protein
MMLRRAFRGQFAAITDKLGMPAAGAKTSRWIHRSQSQARRIHELERKSGVNLRSPPSRQRWNMNAAA